MYAREFDGKKYNFGVIGFDQGTLIMYDDQTKYHWSQLFGKAVRGKMEGTNLEKLPSTMTTWAEWKKLHPETTVYVKRSVPYTSRFTTETFAKAANMEPGPARSNDLVVGIVGHVDARAYLVRRLAKERLVEEQFEGSPIAIYLSEDYATAKVFDRILDGHTVSLRLADDGTLEDKETGSRFNPVSGEAISGPLEGMQLRSLISTLSVWFAWQHYRPDTSIRGESD